MSRVIRVGVPESDLAVTVDLLDDVNPESADAVWAALPLRSSFGHTVVSGGGVWIPTTIVYLGQTVPRRRTIGSVYLYGPMQIIALTYGQISESAFVNEVGRVRDGDLDILSRLGAVVWENTIRARPSRMVPAFVERDLT